MGILSPEIQAQILTFHYSDKTLHEWVKVHAEFSEAKRQAYAKNLLFYEKLGLTDMAGKIKGFNATVWIFNMKNRHKWRDVHSPDESNGPSDAEKALAEALSGLDKIESKSK